MHELALARALIDQLAEEAARHDFARVVRVELVIGALGHVEPDALARAFEVAAPGTLADGATLNITRVGGAAHCLDCDADVTIRSRADLCPMCGGARLVVTGGEDMKIRELEVG
jgi:hydrogenase nickel incorporation protein HypA/HybF